VNVVDSSAWIEYFTGGPNARRFSPPIHRTSELLVPSICLLEVYRWVLRNAGRPEALRVAASMRQGRLVELDTPIALHAAELGQAHGLPLADSVIYATARLHQATVWTQDSDFEGLEDVRFLETSTRDG